MAEPAEGRTTQVWASAGSGLASWQVFERSRRAGLARVSGLTLIQDGGDDLELPCTAARAALHIDVKHALEQSRPVDASRPGLQSVDFALAGAGGEDARIVPGWGESAQTAPEETLDQCTDW